MSARPARSIGSFAASASPAGNGPPDSHSAILEQLRGKLQAAVMPMDERRVVATRFDTLNHLLPDRGIRAGTVVEWVSGEPGCRTSTVAFAAASRLLKQPGALAVVDPLHCLCAAALPQVGIPLSRLLLVRPERTSNASTFVSEYRLSGAVRTHALWALEQLARCTGVAVAFTWIDRLSATAQRRLQLAVERSGTTIFLIRPSSVLHQPTWADLRFLVQADGGGAAETRAASPLQVQLIRSRNSVHQQGRTRLECEYETSVVSEVS